MINFTKNQYIELLGCLDGVKVSNEFLTLPLTKTETIVLNKLLDKCIDIKIISVRSLKFVHPAVIADAISFELRGDVDGIHAALNYFKMMRTVYVRYRIADDVVKLSTNYLTIFYIFAKWLNAKTSSTAVCNTIPLTSVGGVALSQL